jgi:hypothetical protein
MWPCVQNAVLCPRDLRQFFIFAGFSIVLIGFVLWPTSDVLHHPEHWYECMLQCSIVWCGELLADLSE